MVELDNDQDKRDEQFYNYFKVIAKYTDYYTDYFICSALYKNHLTSLQRQELVKIVDADLKSASNLKKVNVDPAYISRRLTALSKLHVVTKVQSGNKYSWKINLLTNFDDVVNTQRVKDSVVTVSVDSKEQPTALVTKVLVNRRPIVTTPTSIPTKVFDVVKPVTVVEAKEHFVDIQGENYRRKLGVYYYFIKYTVRDYMYQNTNNSLTYNEVISTKVNVYSTDHLDKIKQSILDKLKFQINVEKCEVIIDSLSLI